MKLVVPSKMQPLSIASSSTASSHRFEFDGSSALNGRLVADDPVMSCRFLMEVRKRGRPYQEDGCAIVTWTQKYVNDIEAPVALFAVMDGHGDHGALGPLVAERMAERFEQVLAGLEMDWFDTNNRKETEKSLASQATLVDESLPSEGLGEDFGTTFSFAFVTGTHVAMGHTGDSHVCYRTYNAKKVRADYRVNRAPTFGASEVEESEEDHRFFCSIHKVEMLDEETKRKFCPQFEDFERLKGADDLELSHGYVRKKEATKNEANGTLVSMSIAMTRSFGDFDFKSNSSLGGGLGEQAVIARPIIVTVERDCDKKEALGLFTDGVIFKNAREGKVDCYDATESLLKTGPNEPLQDTACFLFDRTAKHSYDNAGMILVLFEPHGQVDEDNEIVDAGSAEKAKASYAYRAKEMFIVTLCLALIECTI